MAGRIFFGGMTGWGDLKFIACGPSARARGGRQSDGPWPSGRKPLPAPLTPFESGSCDLRADRTLGRDGGLWTPGSKMGRHPLIQCRKADRILPLVLTRC